MSHTKLRPCKQSSLWSRLQTTLAQIARIAPKWIYIVLKLFSPFTIFKELELSLKKTELPWNFSLYWIYFLHSGFLTTCACPEKQGSPGIFHYIEYTFYIQEFWATCMCLPWKTEGALNSQYWLHVFYIQDFWETCAFAEKPVCPGIFHCIEIFFIIQDFWANCACPEKQSCPEMFRCMEYTFFIQNFWAISMRLPWKTELSWYFSLYLNMYFHHSGFLSN